MSPLFPPTKDDYRAGFVLATMTAVGAWLVGWASFRALRRRVRRLF